MNIGVVITSRIQSRRLPSKAIRKIGNRTALEILIDNLQRQKQYQVILAIPRSSDCDILEEIGRSRGVQIHRGQDDSPLHRIHESMKRFKLDHVVRITQDDILIDASQMCNQIKRHLAQESDYTYMHRIPDGCAGEVISRACIEAAVEDVGGRPTEMISYYCRRPEKFKVTEYRPIPEYQYTFRLTMDYEQDLSLLRAVFAQLHQPVGTMDIINLLKDPRNSHLLEINRLPEITVYTSCYNQGEYLGECLDSIAAQYFEDFDLIIADDCSTDETPAVIAEWLSRQSETMRRRTRVERWQQNIGLPASANKCLHLARGKYIVRVDSDDCIDASFLSTMHRALESNRDNAAVFSAYREFNESGIIRARVGNDSYHPGCAMFRKGAIHDVMYREDLKHYEGLEFWTRFSSRFPSTVIDDVIWSYRKHDKSKSAQDTPERKAALASIKVEA